jgi:uncharacterized protein
VLEKGYLTLPSVWLKTSPSFSLNIPLTPRWISSHPYTNQNIVALARGPMVYCVEDIDNAWVEDHFKTLVLDPLATAVEEESVGAEEMGEPYGGRSHWRGGRREARSGEIGFCPVRIAG